MITVRWLQINSIVLKGHVTDDRIYPLSHITVEDDRYHIVLNLKGHSIRKRYVEQKINVTKTIRFMLDSLGIDEPINEQEIIEHLEYLIRRKYMAKADAKQYDRCR